jgi:general secretion pathway protein B
MSYILDALRRAEADRERERGQVPGLHAQPPSGRDDEPAAGQPRWLPWAGGGLLLLAGIGAGSWWASGPQETPLPPPPPAALALPPVPVPAPAPLAEQPASPTATQPLPQATVSQPMPPPAASPYLTPTPQPPAVLAAPPRPVRPAAPAFAPAPATAQTTPAASPGPAAEARIPRLSELPESTRRELPKLAISGSVFSDDPASRFVIINGEVAREGAKLGADLVLEQIGPRELLLRFKGQRFRQPV